MHPTAIATGDFDGDGLTDIAICNSGDATITVLLSNGDGSFTAAASPAAGTLPNSIAGGDFNGDGIVDLAVADNGEDEESGGPVGTVTILLRPPSVCPRAIFHTLCQSQTSTTTARSIIRCQPGITI